MNLVLLLLPACISFKNWICHELYIVIRCSELGSWLWVGELLLVFSKHTSSYSHSFVLFLSLSDSLLFSTRITVMFIAFISFNPFCYTESILPVFAHVFSVFGYDTKKTRNPSTSCQTKCQMHARKQITWNCVDIWIVAHNRRAMSYFCQCVPILYSTYSNKTHAFIHLPTLISLFSECFTLILIPFCLRFSNYNTHSNCLIFIELVNQIMWCKQRQFGAAPIQTSIYSTVLRFCRNAHCVSFGYASTFPTVGIARDWSTKLNNTKQSRKILRTESIHAK